MEDYSIEKLTKHIERAKTMGMPKEAQVLGDFVSFIKTKGQLTSPQKRYADFILGYTTASDLLMFLEYKDKFDRDEEYREQVLFLGGGTEILPSGGPNSGFQGWGAPRTYALELKYSM